MPYKKELIEEVEKLLKEGERYRTITEKLSINDNDVTAIKQGFKSLTEYKNHLARKQGFKSLTEYNEHLAKEKGFKSLTEYKNHLARKHGFKSLNEYHNHLAKKQGFKSLNEYQNHLAKKQGFKSHYEYNEHRKYMELVSLLAHEGISFEVFELAFDKGIHNYLPEKIREIAESETSFFYMEDGELRLKHDHPYLLQDGRLEKILKKFEEF